MTPPGICEEYRQAAEEAGLIIDVGGHPCVAGEYLEPLSGERQCLVEYADPALLSAADGAGRLARQLAARFPDSTLAVVRTPGDVHLPAGWARHLTYVQRTRAACAPARAARGGIVVTAAEERDDEQVAHWLVQAFQNACTSQSGTFDDGAARAQTQGILSAPDRRSLIARSSATATRTASGTATATAIGTATATATGTAIGHATLLCAARDDVRGESFVELLDILVDPPQQRRDATAALVDACQALADGFGLPLVGHVVHPRPSRQRAEGQRVLESLLDNGWQLRHSYWCRPLRPAGARRRGAQQRHSVPGGAR
ncbi:hypothetical protein [Kitasatospora mediocidica]|uniref:hypothetical protein n=1 Tax=Kitasatospora mediocidica TaxID=58352 RepID=UPI0018DD08BF|nr:hypothetical protein [Kitasatospora mediocidica]